MKGKKTNYQFISQFITDCANNNLTSSEEIILSAKNKIQEIDEKLKEINNLKKLRSNFLDVINSFEQEKKNNFLEKEKYRLFSIGNLSINRHICQFLEKGDLKISDCKIPNISENELFWSIKQLLINKIVDRSNDYLIKGSQFDNYVKLVLNDTIC